MYFEAEFPEDFDTVYISLNYPYTHTRLISLISYLEKKYDGNILNWFVVGKTASDNVIEGILI